MSPSCRDGWPPENLNLGAVEKGRAQKRPGESRMEEVSTVRSHGGVQGVYRHQSRTTNCPMTFSVFVPPQAAQAPTLVLWHPSGLTCTPPMSPKRANSAPPPPDMA